MELDLTETIVLSYWIFQSFRCSI